jgi:acyl carrier protein
VEELLIDLVRKQMVHLDCVNMDSALAEMGYESFTFIVLVVAIEEEFGIEFNDEDLDYRRFENLRTIADYVEDYSAARDKTARRG